MTEGRKPGNRRHLRATTEWTREDMKHLRALVRMRCAPKQVAEFLHRSTAAVKLFAWRNGIKFRHLEDSKNVRRKRQR